MTEWVVGKVREIDRLRKDGRFEEARQVGREAIQLSLSADEREAIDVRRALATYKDPELAVREKLLAARRILEPHLSMTRNSETLGVAGAIEKRFYEIDTRIEHLERSAALYEAGHRLDRASNWAGVGYTGINAAFVLDLMATVEERAGGELGPLAALAGLPTESAARRKRAADLRHEILKIPPSAATPVENAYWHTVTLAEADVGLGNLKSAQSRLRTARELAPDPWMKETTALQIGRLLRLRSPDGIAGDEEHETLEALVGDAAYAVSTALRGRLGLALSGGGFRASLYHIGVLAWLAESGLLPYVEVVSCVSGGSLLGALYALEIKALYEQHDDASITRELLAGMVARIAKKFAHAIQTNIRTQVAVDACANYRMLSGKLSRGERVAELYEKHLYGGFAGQTQKLTMDDLVIRLKGNPETLHLGQHNWERRNKVPVVVFNATTLNTGHAWQFTSEKMGEPPPEDQDVDLNDRFVRQPYRAFGMGYTMGLARAAAASACVPGLFDPLALDKEYPNRRVLLVDGGVYDNQGIRALLEQDCVAIIASDASNQMTGEDLPKAAAPQALLRSDSIFQSRMREVTYQDLCAREEGRLLSAWSFLHLKQGIGRVQVLPGGATTTLPLRARSAARPEGISREMQERLARVRTDLDTFSELEGEALMAAGYQTAKACIEPAAFQVPAPKGPFVAEKHFPFLRVRPLLEAKTGGGATGEKVLAHLAASESSAGRVFRVHPPARYLGIAALVLIAVLGLAAAIKCWDSPVTHLTVGGVVVLLVAALIRRWSDNAGALLDVLDPRTAIAREVRAHLLAWVGAAAARFQVKWLDPIWLRHGEVEPLLASWRAERASQNLSADPASAGAGTEGHTAAGPAMSGIVAP